MRNNQAEIKSLARAADVLDLFAQSVRELTFTEVARGAGLSKTTAHRLLSALTELGLLRRTGSGQATFALGIRLVELGAAAAAQIDLRAELRPFLRALTGRTRETSNLAVLVGGKAIVIDQVESPDEFRMFARIGRSVPAATSSLGKVLFANSGDLAPAAVSGEAALPGTANGIVSKDVLAGEFERVRRQGYALDQEENRPGVFCIGAPVHDLSGEVVAAISISGPSARLAGERLEESIGVVLETAHEASRVLGYQPNSLAGAAGKRAHT